VRYGGPLVALICPHSKTLIAGAGKLGQLESTQKARGTAPIIPKPNRNESQEMKVQLSKVVEAE
jgi:hypothetical protein